ncbi:hypothetical protein TanjilG_04767 [Lupinus angustifolius]|uniref:Glutamyl-tRNA(Gln) amidotransferase subunit C, chloroplastic/mitochondrial n=1 Tax=Lupinus angustifolius TaxID=3871 RepID=A0A4P1RKX0_LUPAN|nr:PREDICTED: glutamyl-tRNA(Gln) amidotransferase subunit C, chloroplastic/mitochondrial [Lupinus angustifolius]OIW12603.1 hypothetical protein TanjilG_04767 [Lupinus angustifolius]
MGSISRGVLTNPIWQRRFCFNENLVKLGKKCSFTTTTITTTTRCSVEHPSPDVYRLAKTAQISLTPSEVEEFGPKIQQVVDWFGQLQGVDLETIEPSIRAGTENNLRENAPETFENRDAIVAAIPTYEEPFIKVPKVLSMD